MSKQALTWNQHAWESTAWGFRWRLRSHTYQQPLETPISPNLFENSNEAFLHWESKLLCAMAWGGSNIFASLLRDPRGHNAGKSQGWSDHMKPTHTRGSTVLPAELGKVTLPQGDWQSSQETGNYLMRLVRVSHLGLETHVRWFKKRLQYAVH